jgi:hypothetical protein
MVLLVELVLPVEASDRAAPSSLRRDAALRWDDAVWGALEPQTVALIGRPDLLCRAAAARAQASLRSDIVVLPAEGPSVFDTRVFGRDTALLPLWRDLALTGVPAEASLSSLGGLRPLVLSDDPRWGGAIGRHLVPLTLLERFEPEPRGAADRRRALEEFAPIRDRLASSALSDPVLAATTASTLRARALLFAPFGDRELSARAVSDQAIFERLNRAAGP